MLMKLWFASLSAALALNSASAQLLSPESLQYSFLGAMIGGAVGGDSHCVHYHWSGENAAIGAGVGLLAGTLLGQARRQQSYSTPAAYPPAPGYGYAPYPSYAPPAPAPAPATYTSAPARPNYAIGGTLVGAASGALIGEGVSGEPGKGAAIGAAAGLVLGGLAEHSARKHEAAARNTAVQPEPPPAASSSSGPPAPASAGSASKSVWQSAPAPQHQIPDAPRVPDAPTL